MRTIKIAGRKVGENQPCYVIAEAGANFRISKDPDTNFRQAIDLIDLAARAGADAVKFQLYRAETLYVKKAGFADYLGSQTSIFDIIQEMELPGDWLPDLAEHCRKKKIVFLCTPFDEKAVDQLEAIEVPAYKIASYTISHIPLLKYIAAKNKPVILSTGASDMADIEAAVKAVREAGNQDLILMQCTAKYPAPLESLHLKTIPALANAFGLPVGFSDHSRNPVIGPAGAVAMGACMVEKHFTTGNDLPGPDHAFAILPDELDRMVRSIRMMEHALGDETKKVQDQELELYEFARRSIYARIPIAAGEIITDDHLIILRSGKQAKGLPPALKETIIGKRAKKKIASQEPISRYNVQM